MPTTQAAQGLGRLFDVVGVASGNMFSVKNCAAWSLIVEASGASTVTIVAAKSYGGSTTNFTTANGFGQPAFWYQNTAHDGTAQWTKQTASWSSNVLTLAGTSGYMSVVTFYGTQMADGYDYFEVSATANTTYCVAVVHDLQVARTPANLVKLGA